MGTIENNRFCTPKSRENMMSLIQNVYEYYIIASRVNLYPLEGNFTSDISNFINQYNRKLILADEAYFVNCGCEPGFSLFMSKKVSELIPSLEDTTYSLEKNLEKIASSSFDKRAREKAVYLLKLKNYNPSKEQVSAIDIHSFDDIEEAVELTKQKKPDWIQFRDGTKRCISNSKNYKPCNVRGEPVTEVSNGVEEGNCNNEMKKCFDYGCDQRPCPKGWVEVDRPKDVESHILKKLPNVAMQGCADTCYWNPQCTLFEAIQYTEPVTEIEDKECNILCGLHFAINEDPVKNQNCLADCKKKVPNAKCNLMSVADQTSARKKRILSARDMTDEMKAVYCAPAGFSSKKLTARWQSLGENKIIPCTQLSDVQLDCNGRILRVKNNRTVENEKSRGTFDGYNSISWTNGQTWVKKGPLEYVCYNFTPLDIQWKKDNSASDKDVCEKNKGTFVSNGTNPNGVPSMSCGKNCKCCKVDSDVRDVTILEKY